MPDPSSATSSWASSPARRAIMQGNRGRDTAPELALRRILHSQGLRYRVHRAPVAGLRRRADIVFVGVKVAVFLDGCFWHLCPDHGHIPLTNHDYWEPKLLRNVQRDRDTDTRLAKEGWASIRIWEHQDPETASLEIAKLVHSRRKGRRRVT